MPLDRHDVLLRKAKQDEFVLERRPDDRDAMRSSPEELPVIDIHSL